MGPGREAATVRQVILVVVLVAAAFLGGAFVNGPGLRWAQTQLLGSLGLGAEGGEIPSVDLKAGASPDAPGDDSARARAAFEAARGPVAPAPSVVAEASPGKSGATDRPDASGGQGQRRYRSPSSSPSAQSALSVPPPLAPPAAFSRAGADDPRGGETPPPLPAVVTDDGTRDPGVTQAALPSSPPARPGPAPADRDREVRPALMDSLASLMPSPAPAPPESLRPSDPSPAPPPEKPTPEKPGADDWATLARKMQALGVSRFTIEGQPGGRVVFSCLIPVAGRQAVAQRFEAEGDDAVQAARAALRRVALWRAAQPPR
jgi:hypothetical protein